MEIGRSLRAVRAAVFAAACVGVSAAGHVWMSGCAVPLWALLTAILAAGGAGYALAGAQRGFASLAALMLGGELELHVLFAASQHTDLAATASMGSMTSTTSTISMASMPWMGSTPGIVMQHPVQASAWLCGGSASAAGSSGGGATAAWMHAGGCAGMIAVHVVAGLLCAWWLRCGEAAAFRLLRALAHFTLAPLLLDVPHPSTVADLATGTPDDRDEHAPTCRRLLGYAVARRGPPRTPVLCV